MGLWEQFPYPDYHNLNLDWILQKIKEFGVTIDGLDEYIEQKIKEGLDALGLEQIVIDILSKYAYAINVKTPPNGLLPALGNGTTNDYATIQGCIDYASSIGGGVVFFPYGKYLTNSLSMRSNVSILGFDQYSTELILSGGANKPLISGTIDNVSISGLTLNAKQSSQVNNIDAIELLGHHINLENVIAEDCYTSINIEKNGTSIVIKNVICNIASDACLRVGGTNGGLLVDGLDMTGLSTNLGAAYIVSDSNDDVYKNINIHGSGAIGIDVAGSGNYFEGRITGVTEDYNNINGDNTFNIIGKSSDATYVGTVKLKANDIIIDPVNPITYKVPINYNDRYSYVPAKDRNNVPYNILVAGENFNPNQDSSLTLDGTPTAEKFNIKTVYTDDSSVGVSIGEYFYRTSKPEKDLNTLTIATYNVLSTDYWRWPPTPPTDTDTGLAHAVEVIIKSGAKIIGMNEISNSPKFTPIKKLSTIRFSDVYYEGAVSPELQGTKLGNAIMSDSNFPLLDKNVTIMPDGADNRILLNVKINVNGKTLSIYCTQLSLNTDIRAAQITTILNKMSADGSAYKILMGDLNFVPSEPEFARITRAGYVSTNTDKPTYPSDSPATIIDYIFRTPNITVNNYDTIADVLASDHCLLFANITLN